MDKYCSYCNKELESCDSEWVKYGDADCDEIVSVYKCEECGRTYTKRKGNFSLEEREEW